MPLQYNLRKNGFTNLRFFYNIDAARSYFPSSGFRTAWDTWLWWRALWPQVFSGRVCIKLGIRIFVFNCIFGRYSYPNRITKLGLLFIFVNQITNTIYLLKHEQNQIQMNSMHGGISKEDSKYLNTPVYLHCKALWGEARLASTWLLTLLT